MMKLCKNNWNDLDEGEDESSDRKSLGAVGDEKHLMFSQAQQISPPAFLIESTPILFPSHG